MKLISKKLLIPKLDIFPINFQFRFLWISFALSTLILLLIAAGWIYSGVSFSDVALWGAHHEVFLQLNYFSKNLPIGLVQTATMLGDTSIILLILSPFFVRQPAAWLASVFSAPVGGIASITLKNLTSIPRPAAIIDESSYHIVGQVLTGHNSFPSGHCITIFAVASAIIVTRSLQSRSNMQWMVFIALILLSLFVCYTRIAVGAHWPVDIAAGAAIGWIAGFSGVYLIRLWAKQGVEIVFSRTRQFFIFVILLCITHLLLKWSVFFSEQILLILAIGCGLLAISLMWDHKKNDDNFNLIS